jgi:hypothetical protein
VTVRLANDYRSQPALSKSMLLDVFFKEKKTCSWMNLISRFGRSSADGIEMKLKIGIHGEEN